MISRPAGSSPTPEPAAAPGHPTADGYVTPGPSVPAPPPPETSPRPADRPLTPDTADRLVLATILDGAAVRVFRGDDRDPLTAIGLSAARCGDPRNAVAQVQTRTCVALLAAHLGLGPGDVAAWAEAPGRAPQEIAEALYETAEEVLRGA